MRLGRGGEKAHISGSRGLDMARFAATVVTMAVLLLGPAGARADTICRTSALGVETCTGPAVRPEPRRQIRSDVQALDRVLVRPDAGQPETEFVPARRRGRLSTTIIDTTGPVELCRADALGNLRCR
jgi:hypothetical protein